MKLSDIKIMIQKYLPLYLPALAISVWMRQLCHISDSDTLTWILTPTARWVSILSGISFEYLPHSGYVNHFHQFLIAPACSGIRFMLLTFLMMVFSFLKPGAPLTTAASARKRYSWLIFSMLFSYLSAILVNGIRISVSVYLPLMLENRGLLKGALTPDRLHTIIGSVVYFSSLYLIYAAADFICRHGFLRENKNSVSKDNAYIAKQRTDAFLSRSVIPAFWYLLIVLAVPFLGRLYRNDWDGFGAYTALILCVCFGVILLLHLVRILRRRLS